MAAKNENVILKAVANSPSSMMEAARIAGIPYREFVRYAIELGIYKQNKVVLAAVAQSMRCMQEAAVIVGIPFMLCKRHVNGEREAQQNNQEIGGITFTPLSTSISLETVLEGKYPKYRTRQLKRRLLQCGIKKNVCEVCGLGTSWLGKPLVLALDHIDGDSTNHRLMNIRMLCPNCHSQTETYCGRNADQHNRKYVSEEEFVVALKKATRISDALKALNMVSSETWYKKARRLIVQHQIGHLMEKTGVLDTAQPKTDPQPNDVSARLERERYLLDQQPNARKVQTSGINFRNPEWLNDVARLIGLEPEAVPAWMQDVMPEFYERKCFKPKTTDGIEAA